MKKIIVSLLLVFSLSFFGVCANAKMPNVVDNADLLSAQEESLLLQKIEDIQNELSFEVVIVTTDDLQGKTTQEYADDFYDYNGYGIDDNHSGALLLIDMETRSWYVSTTGYGIDAIDQNGFYYIENDILPYLSDGEYYEAFDKYADICRELVIFENNGEDVPYEYYQDTYEYYQEDVELTFGEILGTSLVIGFVIALIIVLIMKGKLKTVRAKNSASDYVRPGSLKITHSSEHFLYRNITRTKKQTQNNNSSNGGGVHVSSSGRSHGGGGGSF